MFENFEILGIGSIPLYNLFIGLGIIFGLLYFEFENKCISDTEKFKIYNVLFSSFIFGFFGARVFDLVFFSSQFSLANIISGSSTYMGGLIFALFFSILTTRMFGLNFLFTFNLLIPFILISHIFGRIGCFFAGCCFGKECVNNLFGVNFPIDSLPYTHYGKEVSIHPTQLYEAFGLLLILIIVRNMKNKIVPYLILYGFIRFLIEFYRNDPRGSFITTLISPSQLMSLIFIFVGFLIYINKKLKIIPLKGI